MERPTGWPQFQQNRFDSATTGLTIKAASGSISGTRGISTRPPPSRRVGERLRATVAWFSSASIGSLPTESSSSSKCGRKIAWVDIGRIVATESMLEVVEVGRLGADVGVGRIRCAHQSTYLGVGGAGAGPSTVNHLR